VAPATSPAATPAAAAYPAAENAGPAGAATPAPAITGTAPVLNEVAPALTGSAPVTTGATPVVSGSTMASAPSPPPPSPYSIEIDLGHQRAYLLKDGHKIAESPISSGREGHSTPTGNFEVIQKDLNHFSNLYGKFVEKDSGRVVKSGADAAMPVPKGCKFVPAPMKWFMRFDGAAGMHAGILPGYAASHGCVRMPASKAELFYTTVEVGTPVHVFGSAPERSAQEEEHATRRVAMVTARPASAPAPTPPRTKHGWLWF
jgi:lipoprotein-anchoring transpeptidase ErfK/SrfK